MAILTNPSPTSLSALVPLPPSTGNCPSDEPSSSSHEPVSASQRLDVADHHDKENSPRRASDTVLVRLKANKRRKTNVVSPTKEGDSCLSLGLEEAHQSRQLRKQQSPPCTKKRIKSKPMKLFEEDYYSALAYNSDEEAKREDKKLRFACFTQVKEIPSHRDYEQAELDSMYNNSRTIRENAKRNTKEMWHDVGHVGRRQSILGCASEEDSFHIYQLESGETEFIHPATYSVWLEEQQEKEKREMESWCNENSGFLVDVATALGGDCYDTFGDGGCLPNTPAEPVKTHEDEHCTVFRFGGRHSNNPKRQELEYECDYGVDTIDMDDL